MKRAILLGLLAVSCKHREPLADVPVVEVKRQRFVRTVDADGFLRPTKATPVTVPQDVQWPLRVVWIANDGAEVKKGDVVARFDDLELRSRLLAAELDKDSALAKRGKEAVLSGNAATDRRRTTEAAGRELELYRSFQRKDPEIFSRDQIIEAEIDETLGGARLDNARKSEVVDGQVGQRKVKMVDVEAQKADDAIHRSQKGLGALDLRAPHDGILIIKRNNVGEPVRVGDTVWRSQTIAEISRVVEMEAELYVLELEAAGLAKGKKAEVVVDSRPDQVFGAKVKTVETVAKRREPKSPTQYFGVILSLDRTDPALMKPGQRVRARLLLAETEALVVPRPTLFDRNGAWIAYRRENGGFAPVPVKLGPSTAGLVAIESGLRPHDFVALRDPALSVDDILGSSAGGSSPAGGR
jgi:HlyD family secretion protein